MDRFHLSPEALAAHVARQDMIWDRLPTFWDEAPFLGNGCTGATFYADAQSGRLHIKPGRTDIYDNRPLERFTIMDKQFQQPRLQLGPIELRTKGKLTGCDLRLSLLDATLRGTYHTDCGDVAVTAWIPRDENALVIELCPSEGESAELCYLPMPAESPRQTRMVAHNDRRQRTDYIPPRPALPVEVNGSTELHEQPLFTSGSYTVALRREGCRTLVAFGVSDTDGEAKREALATLDRLAALDRVRAAHLDAWRDIFSRSFLSLSDPAWENFYWAQIYKMAAAARPGGRIIDTMGPWCTTTSWPAAFWNLNVQLTYAPMIPTGLFDICRSLPDTLISQQENLNLNVDPRFRTVDGVTAYGIGTNTCRSLRSELSVPGEQNVDKVELGNLSWVLFVCYTLCRTTLDREMLTGTVLPLLRGCVAYYRAFLRPDEKGVLHLLPTESPEYCVVDEDTNYDLALLRWGLTTLIRENRELSLGWEEAWNWEETLAHLTPYPEDEKEGLFIARNTRLATSHRHYSHLLAFYPLHLLDAKKEADCVRIRRSVAHWHSMPEQLEGYSQTGAASMLAMMGDGDGAICYLDGLMHEFVRPTTMYREDGGPVLETPLAAVSSTVDMLMQCYGGEVNVFPACPSRWTDVSFTLFAEGGFTVSAARRGGRLAWVRVRAKEASELALIAPFGATPECDHAYTARDGRYIVALDAGEEVLFRTVPEEECLLAPVALCETNVFGMNERTFRYVEPISHPDRVKAAKLAKAAAK